MKDIVDEERWSAGEKNFNSLSNSSSKVIPRTRTDITFENGNADVPGGSEKRRGEVIVIKIRGNVPAAKYFHSFILR